MSDVPDTAEFEALVQRNRGRLLAIARMYAGHEADDLLQEILLQIWRSRRSFQERSHFDTWCYRVALNTAMTWRRNRLRSSKRLSTAATNLDQLPAAEKKNRGGIQLLEAFAQSLNEVDRALLLMYLDEMSGDEIAQTLGISPGAVRVRIHRLKQTLAQWQVNHEP